MALIVSVGHYCWLHNLIHQLPPNNKADYLVHNIRHILYLLTTTKGDHVHQMISLDFE
jgi:hypothetical protein